MLNSSRRTLKYWPRLYSFGLLNRASWLSKVQVEPGLLAFLFDSVREFFADSKASDAPSWNYQRFAVLRVSAITGFVHRGIESAKASQSDFLTASYLRDDGGDEGVDKLFRGCFCGVVFGS